MLTATMGRIVSAEESLPAQAGKPTTKPRRPPTEAQGTLFITTDAACTVSLDGQVVGQLQPEEMKGLKLNMGSYLISATRTDGRGPRWEERVVIGSAEPAVVRIRFPRGAPKQVQLPGGIALVSMPAGEAWVGCVPGDRLCDPDETPRHRVRITQPFWLNATEVTVAQFREFARATRRRFPLQPRWSAPAHPVVNVTWDDATAFCEWLGGRLPTEAEWEYAARAEGQRSDPPEAVTRESANYGKDRCCGGLAEAGDRWENSAPVRSFPAGPRGLYDMLGNVWEWCADWYRDGYYAETPLVDPRGPESGLVRAVRGGSWSSPPKELRASNRNGLAPEISYEDVGFRCALDRAPQQ